MFSTIIQFFEKQLAGLFDKLRIASPVVYTVVLILLFGGVGVIENFTDLAEDVPWLFNGIVDEIITALAAILLSSRTKRHLDHADDGADGATVMDIDHDD